MSSPIDRKPTDSVTNSGWREDKKAWRSSKISLAKNSDTENESDENWDPTQPRNYTEAIQETLDTDRTLQKYEMQSSYLRLSREIDTTQENFTKLFKLLKQLQAKVEKMDKELKDVKAKLNRRTGFFANLVGMIPFGNNVLSAIDTVKDVVNICSDAWQGDGNVFQKISNVGKGIVSEAWESAKSTFSM